MRSNGQAFKPARETRALAEMIAELNRFCLEIDLRASEGD
jgi:hypothetical protein